jgi:hypothetical protein
MLATYNARLRYEKHSCVKLDDFIWDDDEKLDDNGSSSLDFSTASA